MGLFSYFPQSSRVSPRSPTSGILIVEDEALVAFDNEYALAQAGHRVVATVDRFDHAVEAMAEGEIDLVISDIRLSGAQNGIDVARY